MKGSRRIGSAYPLIRGGEVVGAIARLILHSLDEMERMKNQVEPLRSERTYQYRAAYTFDNILGISASIKEAVNMAKKVAITNADVLITGESRTGKELLAQSIHNFGNPERPFVRVNCPAIPFELAESDLFGYEKGAFTGASATGKSGKFELAHNGTLFLDEIGSLPLSIQAKLLRVLQEREIERLGSTGIKKVNFRLVAASFPVSQARQSLPASLSATEN